MGPWGEGRCAHKAAASSAWAGQRAIARAPAGSRGARLHLSGCLYLKTPCHSALSPEVDGERKAQAMGLA